MAFRRGCGRGGRVAELAAAFTDPADGCSDPAARAARSSHLFRTGHHDMM
jgi:hypothetical protein